MDETTIAAVKVWFDAFKDVLVRMKIEEKDIYNMAIIGFSGKGKESYGVAVDSTHRTRHRSHPIRQPWVSIMECICMDGTAIEPLVIFKDQNVLPSGLPSELSSKCVFSATSTGWRRDFHPVEWLDRVFEPATRAKAAGHQRLLICDGHNSHISGGFISHCFRNRVSLLIAPPHISHLLQPFDVAIFGPLKMRLAAELSHLNESQLVQIRKAEWLNGYIQARTEGFSSASVESAFRGAGLKPFQPQQILGTMRNKPVNEPMDQTQTPTELHIFDRVFANSFPPDLQTLREANQVLKNNLQTRVDLDASTIHSMHTLADGVERLTARAIIRQRELENLRKIVGARKERKKGRRAALRGHFRFTIAELRTAVAEAEEEVAARPKEMVKKEKDFSHRAKNEIEAGEDIEEEFDNDMDELGW